MSTLPRVCIIGAGSSGIAGAKILHERGIPFDCYELSDRVGGNWVLNNKNGMSSSYRTLHINTSRERMEYADFPMPKSYPDFPRHDQIAAYFDSYVEHFGFRDKILFETGVEKATRRDDGVWEIRTTKGETKCYDAVMVANGHHWDPRWPEPAFPGHDIFKGRQMHAHDYRETDELEGKRVVTVGIGNSAMDLAVDASYNAEDVYLSARRGSYVLPKYIFGRPSDQIGASTWMPFAIRGRIFQTLLKFYVGDVENYGLPKPDHRFGGAHPTVSSRILDRIAHGVIKPKPNIRELRENSVVFEDGTEVEADVVIYCTGYKVTFPFFEDDFISAPDNDLPLYRRVFHPEVGGVFFLSLLQPLGATMPLAEAQAKWVADYLKGEYALPSKQALLSDIRKDREKMFKRYVASKRHTMQVDFDDYLVALAKEEKAGADRARAAGFAMPIPARASASAPEPVAA